MYAVIKTGGKQYKVSPGDSLRVEKLLGEAGEKVELNEVLMVVEGEKVDIGAPLLQGVSVQAEITAQGRGPKILIIKFRRRKHHKKQMGHRQSFTQLKITEIKRA
jgi:large subunit ribosomal protein L21